MRRINTFLFLLIILLILTGCLDVVNIEDRGFVIGSAIDLIESEDRQQPIFQITNQIVVPAGMIPGSEESGVGGKAFLNYTEAGKSIYKMDEKVTTASSKIPYYGHLAILVVSDKVAKEEYLFMKLLDTYIRDVKLRRGIEVVISDGEAKKMLEFTTPNHRLPANNIIELLEKSSQEIGLLFPKTSGDIEEFHLENNSYVLPYLQITDKLEYSSGAVFHGPLNKMIGTLDDDDMLALGLIKGEQTPSIIDFPYKGESFAIRVIELKHKLTVDPSDLNEIKVKFAFEIEGIIKESFAKEDFTQAETIKSIQSAITDHLEKMLMNVLQKGQEDLGTDIFEIHEQLKTKHYETWRKIKDQWEEGEYYFKNVAFEVDVKTEIYSTGETQHSK